LKLQTVLLNGEHALLRDFLRAWLERFKKLKVVAESGDASQTMALVRKHKPSLVLMDFNTLLGASLEVLAKIRAGFPKVKVIIYFAYSNDNFAIKVIRAGAAGLVLKNARSSDMEQAIRTVLNGGVYLSSEFLRSLGSSVIRRGIADRRGKLLGRQEAEILKLTALGLPARAVAFELRLENRFVISSRLALMKRLGVKSNAGLARSAVKFGLIPP
jgi:DNA-binding NarL/FixJ family response regulator